MHSQGGPKIFGFSEFISALALLVIVYTVTDIRYRFRVEVAPLPLFRLTYVLIAAIGFGALLTEVWFAEDWLVPLSFLSQSLWQGILGLFFLSLAMTWIYYGFIVPPIFGEKNYREFAQTLYRVILKGSDSELPIIADELGRSAESLVVICREIESDRKEKTGQEQEKHRPKADAYAHDVLLLIGNRKLCRHIVASAPGTAIAVFSAMTKHEKYKIPVGHFAQNITTEAIINKDSILYHEDEGYRSGLIGYLKPFSQAIYGNYSLVESLRGGSPLDVHYETIWSWNASQFHAYSRAILHTLEDYLKSGSWGRHSYVLYRALKNMESSCRDAYKLNDISRDVYSSDIFKRLEAAVDFVKEAVGLINKQEELPSTILRVRDRGSSQDFYDRIAALMFEIILAAASVKGSADKCWSIHYSAVWGQFFGLSQGKAWDIVKFKLCRLMYNEILRLNDYPNYMSSKVLGFCLNVLGLKMRGKNGCQRAEYPLCKVVLFWARNNYLHLRNVHPEVAESCLIGSVSFDEKGGRLVKTYAKDLNLEPSREYLELVPPAITPPASGASMQDV